MNDTLWIDSDKFRLPYVAVVHNSVEYNSIIRKCSSAEVSQQMVTENVSVTTIDSCKGLISIVMLHGDSNTKAELYTELLNAAITIVDDFNEHHSIAYPDKTYNRLAVASIYNGLLEHCDKTTNMMY